MFLYMMCTRCIITSTFDFFTRLLDNNHGTWELAIIPYKIIPVKNVNEVLISTQYQRKKSLNIKIALRRNMPAAVAATI